ncbi:MAG: hypothetical protein WA885_07485 [Phormidesmis sp.]
MTQSTPFGDRSSDNLFLQGSFTDEQTQDKQTQDKQSDDKKFELLSAYLDGEVSEQEYRLVNHWISSNPVIWQQYQEQMKLRQAIRKYGAEQLKADLDSSLNGDSPG